MRIFARVLRISTKTKGKAGIMSVRKQRLELTWIGKDERPRLEPRILLEDMDKSYHAKARVTENDIFDNILIHGDNLLALKALEQDFTGKIKCIYIDPPFNTGAAFEYYDDNLEHSLWLGMFYERIQLLHRLRSRNGPAQTSCTYTVCVRFVPGCTGVEGADALSGSAANGLP
jgi:hypothetical protein